VNAVNIAGRFIVLREDVEELFVYFGVIGLKTILAKQYVTGNSLWSLRVGGLDGCLARTYLYFVDVVECSIELGLCNWRNISATHIRCFLVG
jgi:hypothetical protein